VLTVGDIHCSIHATHVTERHAGRLQTLPSSVLHCHNIIIIIVIIIIKNNETTLPGASPSVGWLRGAKKFAGQRPTFYHCAAQW